LNHARESIAVFDGRNVSDIWRGSVAEPFRLQNREVVNVEKEHDFASWTPSQLVERYVAENILRPDSIRNYRLAAHVFEKDTGIQQISDINLDCVLKWRGIILNRAKATTWNNYRLHLCVMWNYAVRRHWVEVNPFAEIRPAPVLKKEKKTISNDLLAATIDLLRNPDKAPKPAWFWLIAVRLSLLQNTRLSSERK